MANTQKCPRCGQGLRIDHDEYGWYLECFVCGFTHDLNKVSIKQKSASRAEKER